MSKMGALVLDIQERLEVGDSVAEIAEDFNLTVDEVQAVADDMLMSEYMEYSENF